MLLYPTGPGQSGLTGAVTAAVVSAIRGAAAGPKRTIPQSVLPVTLFIWGPGRIVPVRVTDLTITEQLYDASLNPIHAEAQLSLPGPHPGRTRRRSADLGRPRPTSRTVAYQYTLSLRQVPLAIANLVEHDRAPSSG